MIHSTEHGRLLLSSLRDLHKNFPEYDLTPLWELLGEYWVPGDIPGEGQFSEALPTTVASSAHTAITMAYTRLSREQAARETTMKARAPRRE